MDKFISIVKQIKKFTIIVVKEELTKGKYDSVYVGLCINMEWNFNTASFKKAARSGGAEIRDL